MNLIALDPSLRRIGVYISSQNKSGSKRYEYNRKLSRLEALTEIYRDMNALIRRAKSKHDLQVGIIEGYIFSKKSSSITSQAEVGGIIRGILGDCGVPIIEVAPLTWKSNMLGKQNIRLKKSTKAQQELYLRIVYAKHKVRFDTTDEADAWMMAKIVEKVFYEEAGDGIGVQNIKKRLIEIYTGDKILTEGVLFGV